MKKTIGIIAVLLTVLGITFAEYTTKTYTPNTNNVVTVTGTSRSGIAPVAIYMDIEGVTTNTVASTYSVSGITNEYTLASLSAVTGGSETPIILANTNAPLVIKTGDTWTLTGSGVAYSNVIYTIVFEFVE